MSLFRLFSPASFVEIDGEVATDAALPGRGDARLVVRTQAGGYAGAASAWVTGDQLARFREALAVLRRSLAGEASLASVSPGELSLRVMSVSARGHLAVQCSLGRQVRTGNARFWHAAALGFEFEAAQLEAAVHAAWLAPTPPGVQAGRQSLRQGCPVQPSGERGVRHGHGR